MTTVLEKKFESVGARVKISDDVPRTNGGNFSINVRSDKKGEFFEIRVKKEVDLLVQDVQKGDRHLVLLAKAKGDRGSWDKQHYLCGHDERHWFCATLPKPVTTVAAAKQSLKPKEVAELERSEGVRGKNVHKRHKRLNKGRAIHRQGEFFFIPEPGYTPDPRRIIKNEPMSGGGGHSHFVSEMVRSGGETVYIKGDNVSVLPPDKYRELSKHEKALYRQAVAGAQVYVRGKVTHVEHKTCDLGSIWHRVHVNRESRTRNERRSLTPFINGFID